MEREKPEDIMNWDILSESFGRITTESNSTDGSIEDITNTNSLTENNVILNELLFDNAKNNTFDLSGLDVISLSPFNKDISIGKRQAVPNEVTNAWANVSKNLQNIIISDDKTNAEVRTTAVQLALANEIEVHAPWVDVSNMAASISETPVSIKDETPENIFTLATFVPTHMQSYMDLNADVMPSANNISQTVFDLETPTVLQVDNKVYNDTELVSNFETIKIEKELDEFLKNTISKQNLDDRQLNTPSPSRVQQNIEINPVNSVLFNTDLEFEETLLFDSDPVSDMYVVQTENIFGKEIAKRNALEKLAADAGICSCVECRCDPSNGECQQCNHEVISNKCPEDKCSCVDCKCDHAAMKCAVGCGMATDMNHNTFLHYHRRHNSSSLEELGVYTTEETEENIIDNLKCSCDHKPTTSKGSCCSKTSDIAKTKSCNISDSNDSCCVTICLKKLQSFKQLLMERDVVNALKSRAHLDLTTS